MDEKRIPARPVLSCSFCGAAQREVRMLIAGPGAFICNACVRLAGGVASSGEAAGTPRGELRAVPEQDTQAQCSWCGKHRDQLASLAALSPRDPQGPTAICPECVSLCDEIIAENRG